MYRYSVDNAVTYTSEDFVLFRESPFACWMERLTLENPDHGIPPDLGSVPPQDSIERQDDLADTLRAEGKDVYLIDWEDREPARRGATLEAMRNGVDFIVNGQLALGPLSGPANLLVRTSGYSELGDFLYIPCDTQARNTLHSAFRLCFLADLLHSLQGQLPPQMLIIRGGDELLPLATDSHIYHYRAVKQRFMAAMRDFRKHRMPDPAESSHFGRWSDCAHEVLKQRILGEGREEAAAGGSEEIIEPLRAAVGAETGNREATAYDLDEVRQTGGQKTNVERGRAAAAESRETTRAAAATLTLADQARMLKPGTYKPGPGVFRLGRPRVSAPGQTGSTVPAEPTPQQFNRRASDKALLNLEFIGRSHAAPRVPMKPVSEQATGPVNEAALLAASSAPSPSLRDTRTRMIPPRDGPAAIDMDSAHLSSPPPVLPTASALSPDELLDHREYGRASTESRTAPGPGVAPAARPFSNSIFTDRVVTTDAAEEHGFSDSLMTSEDYEP